MKLLNVFFSVVAGLTALYSSAFAAGCFGLELGDNISKHAHGQQAVRQVEGMKMFEVTPSQPHELFDTYAVDTYQGNIIRIMASSPDDYSASAEMTLRAYKELRQELALKYGPPLFSFDDVDDAGNDLLDYLVTNDGVQALEWNFNGKGPELASIYVFLRGVEDEGGKRASYCTLYMESADYAGVYDRISLLEAEEDDTAERMEP